MPNYDNFALVYDALTGNVDYKRRAQYFHNLMKPHVGEHSMLLDLACGTGSLSVELAMLGHEVIGVDLSPEMLSVAVAKAYAGGQQILFLNQDMTELDLYGDIDAAVCALDSLNHLSDTAAFARAIARVALFLRPGGVFVFDLNTSYKHREILGDNVFVYDTDAVYCIWQNETEGDVTEVSLDFFLPDGDVYRRYSENFTERAFSDRIVRNALEKAGLELLATYDEDSLSPPIDTSERIIYLTRKAGTST